MSDHWIQFVPADPTSQPTRDAAERAVRILRSYAPGADSVSAEFKEAIEFFHAGGNWSGVRCPRCDVDAESWWFDAVDRAAETSFEDLAVTTPCCGTQTTLSDLHYPWPVAFGRFVLEAMNPNIGDTTTEQDRALSECLGMPLRKVFVHL